ncbi:hypothetical protein [Streptomyces sp. NPDC006446]
MPVAVSVSVGDCFERKRLVVLAVEGELMGGPVVGAQGIGP